MSAGDGTLDVEAEVSIPVRSLASGKKVMDKKMFEALKASKNDLITFHLTSIDSVSERADSIFARASGDLTVAGTSLPVSFPVTVAVTQRGLGAGGSLTVRMSSFGSTPPRAMLGMLRTGDEVTVSFVWALSLIAPRS